MGDDQRRDARRFLFQKMQLRTKLMVSFVAFILLAFFVATTGSYQLVYRTMSASMMAFAEISASQIQKNVDAYVDELYRLTGMAFADEGLLRILRSMGGYRSAKTQLSDAQNIRRLLFSVYSFRPDLYSVILQTNNGEMYIEGFNSTVSDAFDVTREDWYPRLAQSRQNTFLVVGPRISSYSLNAEPAEVFTVARRIVDTNGDRLGVMMLNMNYDTFASIFSELEAGENAQIYLVDEEEQLLYASEAKGMILEPIPYADPSGNPDVFFVKARSQRTGWEVVVSIPRAKLFGNMWTMFQSILLILLICVAFFAFLYAIFSVQIMKPVRLLITSMRRVEKGDFSIHISPVAHDEIGELSLGFNRMVGQINALLSKMVEFEVREKESEFRALQNQINPHFLYNTLETIRMQCIMHRQPDIAEVINTLGNLFRLSIDRQDRFVPIQEELEHVQHYIDIQNFRFDHKFQLTFDVAPEIKSYKIFKLTLQPLVENCVFHGLERRRGAGAIHISIAREKDGLAIAVEDNGLGMEAEKLEEVHRLLAGEGPPKDNLSLGLRNVNERVRLFFGSGYGLSVWSRRGVGTRIVITMPVIENEKDVAFHV